MTDTVINGTRQSRSILGNSDIPLEWPEALAMLKSTGWKVDLGPLNDAGLTTRGTDLNKAALLTDTLCSALGLGTTATPTEAMEKLRQLIATAQSTANGRCSIEAGTYTGNGELTSGSQTIYTSIQPKAVLVYDKGFTVSTYGTTALAVRGKSVSIDGTSILYIGTKQFTVSNTYKYSTYYRLNESGTVYFYMAIG